MGAWGSCIPAGERGTVVVVQDKAGGAGTKSEQLDLVLRGAGLYRPVHHATAGIPAVRREYGSIGHPESFPETGPS